ncbi:DUF6241 domain-containing protein [Bacillus gaemokensis]|uniref:CTP synthase n=1 Tax=Bacillus gaemokensis TaxID=574375 RepID=A0A073KCH0_9BACI|nr:DUF6241 domain-containing protein [Bacillus gaemokensis]KEK24290.1 hypothetical protein BAGA_28390 [Bacillus gaemokensis]KYG38196.1 hypothetical protein AZF08_19340 [Bacillus gaemokensis]
MSKWITWISITSVIVISVIFGVQKFLVYVEEEDRRLKKHETTTQKQIGANESPQYTEGEIISIMHKMVHQKVKSPEKWGFIEMTLEEIKNTKKLVESSKHLNNKPKLLTILERWEKGDFSQTVEEHNFFWKMQGGDTGKAFERLTREEEKQYLEQMKNQKRKI